MAVGGDQVQFYGTSLTATKLHSTVSQEMRLSVQYMNGSDVSKKPNTVCKCPAVHTQTTPNTAPSQSVTAYRHSGPTDMLAGMLQLRQFLPL
jgi:hypothetical protein